MLRSLVIVARARISTLSLVHSLSIFYSNLFVRSLYAMSQALFAVVFYPVTRSRPVASQYLAPPDFKVDEARGFC
ncbi:hypothetical protein F4680DRAFT_304391 [Xylaria scruposa]|nr:hypothetical protein F4680DRAFT_304391 [Xylaria scruposa]